MASGVHAVALRLKQAKKKKLLLIQQQQQLGLKPPLDRVTSVRIIEPNRSPRRSCQGWDATSDVSGMEGRASNGDHRQMADKAYKKWRDKKKIAFSPHAAEFRKSYIAAGQSTHFDALLWFGLTVLLTGTVVSFVGLGEKGFRTSYLRLMGPILCGTGLTVVIIRIGICCFNGRKEAHAQFHIRDKLAKVVTVQQAVAVRSIQHKPSEGPPGIPFIQIDRSCDSGMMKSSVTAGTDLSEGSPVLSGENVPLINIVSADHKMAIAVTGSEWMPNSVDESRSVDSTGSWKNSRDVTHLKLALDPSSLAIHKSNNSSSLTSLHKKWRSKFN